MQKSLADQYDPVKVKVKALKIIKKEKIYFQNDLCRMLGVTPKWFFTSKLNVDGDIVDALINEKIAQKQKMRTIWGKSKNPTLQVALYKLLADEDEYKRLSMSTLGGDPDKPISVRWIDGSNNPVPAVPSAGTGTSRQA